MLGNWSEVVNSLWESLNRHKIETCFYRFFRACILASLVLLFQEGFSLFTSLGNADIAYLVAIIIQLALLVRLPHNDIMPLRNRSINQKIFYTDELKFAFIMIAVVFFMGTVVHSYTFGFFLAANFICQIMLFKIWRKYVLAKSLSQDKRKPSSAERNLVIVGARDRGMRSADMILKHPELQTRIIGFVDTARETFWRYRDIPLIGRPESICRIISTHAVDYIIMATEAEEFMLSREVFEAVEKMGIKICVLPDIYESNISRCCTSSLNGQPVLLYHAVPENRLALLFKAILDRVGGVVGILLSAPIMMLASIAIKIDTHGPVIYYQKRLGRNGRIFKMLKLRTMTIGAEKQKSKYRNMNEMSGPVFKISDDPRVTRVGRFLRKYSVDEMPQFFNVLAGQMSLVGPRPPLPEEVARYAPWQHRRLSVKPGVTCLWQVNGRNKIDFEEWMRLDLEYIDRWSLKEDARILMKTVPTVIKGNGV